MATEIGQIVKLDTNLIVNILGDESFYSKCPAYLFMRGPALASYKKYVAAMQSGTSGADLAGPDKKDCNCKARSDPMGIMAPQVTSFVRHTAALYDTSPDALNSVKAYLEPRLGVPIARLVLTFIASRKEQPRTITF